MEDLVHLDITVWWGAAEPSLALQGVIAHLGVWHSVWSAQKAFTARLLPQTTQIALQVGLIAPTPHSGKLFTGLADASTAIWSRFVIGLGCMRHESLPLDRSMTLVKALKLFGIQFLSECGKW